MPYELDSTSEEPEREAEDPADGQRASDGQTAADGTASSLGVPIPDDHVGPFVAEALEDPERATEWDDIVDAMVAPAARDAWAELTPVEQASEVLSKAADYDRRAIDRFDGVSLDADRSSVQAEIDEGLRCRRNADTFRDGVAAAYDDGRLDDDDVVAALEDADFDTGTIARREALLERLDGAFELDYRPYGGTLMDDEAGPSPDPDHEETW
ncbi:hypothetical protein [Haloarcula litorea]|uniref:hypothetical protein n=1 Tax=Haloarcula litorea TaxID=3032579 RepID=UPI0023E8E9EE|nr:hypothetical protein [Halomicroarcula sp. GDY20]